VRSILVMLVMTDDGKATLLQKSVKRNMTGYLNPHHLIGTTSSRQGTFIDVFLTKKCLPKENMLIRQDADER